jgi:predicted nucleic-acid-binding Zn-ribbon protein
MNFLQLVQRARRRCRVVGTGPTTVLNQAEEYARLVDFTNEAWVEIQLMRKDWAWMRANMSFPTVAGQAEYTQAQIQSTGTNFSNFGNWDLKTFRQYNTAAGTNSEIFLAFREYESWRDTYQISATRLATSAPVEFTVNPTLGIGLGPVPIAGYTITGDYFKVATEMAADADIPGLPTQFHMAIVYRVMMFFGESEAAQEIYDDGKDGFERMMRMLDRHQLPVLMSAGALA